jgi:outer membrane protein assembly factor BamB
MRPQIIVPALLVCFSACAMDVLKESGVEHGLCVVLPADDGESLAVLTRNGAMLVQGLTLDDSTLLKVRADLQDRGVYGLATASKPAQITPLPYADNLINLLIVDLDALGEKAPQQAELLRVITPEGVALLKKNGAWTKVTKPRPAEMDHWTHFDYDAAGGGVSRDTLVKPPTAVQWRLELEPYTGLGGNPAGYRPYTGYRVSGSRAFFALKLGREDDKTKNAPVLAVGRDAFNGLPLWKVPQTSPGAGTPQEYQFAVNQTRLFTFLEPGAFAVGLDAASGKVMTTFENGARGPGRKKLAAGYFMLRATNNLLLQCAEDKLYALDATTGALKWIYEEKEGFVCFPRIQENEKRVLVQIVERDLDRIQSRWANLKTLALACLSLETGKEIWRSNELNALNFGQMISCGESIYAFNPAGIGASENWGKTPGGMVAKLNAADGKLLWKSEPYKWGYNLIVRDGIPYFATPDQLNELSPETGAISAKWKAAFNNRCNRTTATANWLISGMGNYVNREGVATVKGISRGGCAQGVVPANGLLYYTPNICHCITMLRGHLALSSEDVRAPIPNSLRLDKGGAFSTSAKAKPTNLSGPIAAEWLPQIAYGAPETTPLAAGAKAFVSVIHEHRVECREGAGVLWSFTAGGRVSQPPILEQGYCFFGSHDGYLYCLDASNGKLQWRFLAAPYERNFVSHGQLESSWPVYNAVMHGGKICCSAGLHPETGGGIHVWGLDPASGAVAWHKQLKRSELLVKPGGKIAPNRVMNSPLKSDGVNLSITGVVFAQDESEADINSRIDSGSMGDKNRNWGWSLRGPMIESGKK